MILFASAHLASIWNLRDLGGFPLKWWSSNRPRLWWSSSQHLSNTYLCWESRMWTWLYICNFKFLIGTSLSWIKKPLVNLICTSLGILESEIQLVWRGTPKQGLQLKVQLLIRDLYRSKTYLFLSPYTQNIGSETKHQSWHSLKNYYRFFQNLNSISFYIHWRIIITSSEIWIYFII